MPKINLEINRKNLKLMLKGNITNKALKDLARVIDHYDKRGVPQQHSRRLREQPNPFFEIEDNFREISKRLRNKPGFQNIAVSMFEDCDQHCLVSQRVNNVLDIDMRDGVEVPQIRLYRKEWMSALQTLFDNVKRQDAEYAVIHISGLMHKEDIGMMHESLQKFLSDIPNRLFISPFRAKRTLVEIILFGSNFTDEEG